MKQRDDMIDAFAYMLESFKRKPVWITWKTFELFGWQIIIRKKV